MLAELACGLQATGNCHAEDLVPLVFREVLHHETIYLPARNLVDMLDRLVTDCAYDSLGSRLVVEESCFDCDMSCRGELDSDVVSDTGSAEVTDSGNHVLAVVVVGDHSFDFGSRLRRLTKEISEEVLTNEVKQRKDNNTFLAVALRNVECTWLT